MKHIGIILDALYAAAVITSLVMLARILTSCSVTTSPDGHREVAPDYNAIFQIIELIAADEIPRAYPK